MVKKALLIGVNEYEDNNRIRGLQGCVNDVNNFKQALRLVDSKTDIMTLTDKNASKEKIIDRLHWLISGQGKSDSLVLYFAGYGSTLKVKDFEKHEYICGQQMVGYEIICPSDMNIKNGVFISYTDLQFVLKGLKADNKLEVVLDCSFSPAIQGENANGYQDTFAHVRYQSQIPSEQVINPQNVIDPMSEISVKIDSDRRLGKFVIWKASEPGKPAYERRYSSDFEGVFTHNFYKAVDHGPPGMIRMNLYNSVIQTMSVETPWQRPFIKSSSEDYRFNYMVFNGPEHPTGGNGQSPARFGM